MENDTRTGPTFWWPPVKSMKHHLKRIVGSKPLTFEQLTTVTCQIEACLNSRPIMAVTKHNEEGIFSLTSGHFLIGRAMKAYPEKQIPEDTSLLRKWNIGQSMVHHFWTRWSTEYLRSLQARTKWHKKQPNLEVGDVIIIKEDQTFACNWPLARVLQTFPGKDGLVRVALIRTSSGDFKRPVAKLALLHRPSQPSQEVPEGTLPGAVCPDTNPVQCSGAAAQPHLLSCNHHLCRSNTSNSLSNSHPLYHVHPFNITHRTCSSICPYMFIPVFFLCIAPTNPCSPFPLLPFLSSTYIYCILILVPSELRLAAILSVHPVSIEFSSGSLSSLTSPHCLFVQVFPQLGGSSSCTPEITSPCSCTLPLLFITCLSLF